MIFRGARRRASPFGRNAKEDERNSCATHSRTSLCTVALRNSTRFPARKTTSANMKFSKTIALALGLLLVVGAAVPGTRALYVLVSCCRHASETIAGIHVDLFFFENSRNVDHLSQSSPAARSVPRISTDNSPVPPTSPPSSLHSISSHSRPRRG